MSGRKAKIESKELTSHQNRYDSGSFEIISDPSDQEVSLIWTDIKYQAGDLEILKGVSGISRPREVTAIMGTSGSGKTTLLSILSNQIFPNRKNKISGTVKLNDKLTNELDFMSYVKYVMQEDILLPTLSPRETLTFSARLKVGGSSESICNLVDNMLEKLKISEVSDNLIGNEIIKGISGGEKRRLCIGLELISDPSVVILDEPTSGLDSYTAKLVVSLLKHLASEGKTILLTIHQPSEEIFEMIDTLILMARGSFVYQGPAEEARNHFDGLGFVCGDHTPPPDHFMRILHIKNTKSLTADEEKRLETFISSYQELQLKLNFAFNGLSPVYSICEFKPSLKEVFAICLKRSFLNAKRNPMLFAVKVVQALVMGTILSLLFRDLGYSRTQVQNRRGMLFYITINTGMFGVMANTITFPVERPVMIKEYKENLYSIFPYFMSKFIAELPMVLTFTFIYSTMIYFSTDLNLKSASHFFNFFGILFLVHLCGLSLGNFAGAVSSNFEAATMMGPTLVGPLVLFGGFFSNTNSLSTAFDWIKFISPFSRGYEAFVINEFRDLDYDRKDYNGTTPLSELGFSGEIWHKCGAMIIIVVGASVLALTAMKILAEKAKR